MKIRCFKIAHEISGYGELKADTGLYCLDRLPAGPLHFLLPSVSTRIPDPYGLTVPNAFDSKHLIFYFIIFFFQAVI